MDKAKDFEKGWEEYKAKRKQEIEEMAKDFLEIDVYQDDKCKRCVRYICSDKCDDECFAEICAKYFYNLHYRKIPENSVVLTREEWKRMKSSLYYSKEECERRNQKICKETAEKFAERLKEMAYQSTDWSHGEHPMVVEVDYIDEICEEITEDRNDLH